MEDRKERDLENPFRRARETREKDGVSGLLTLLRREELLLEVSEEVERLCPKAFTANSKEVVDGTFFVCKGYTFKKEYLEMAAERGAVFYMAETDYKISLPRILVKDIRRATSLAARWFYHAPGEELFVTGITGTKGKTTTAYILKSILDAGTPGKTAIFSTMEVYTGKKSRISHLTTPEPAELQSYFREAKENGCSHVVMEVSSQAMKLSRVYGELFPIGIFLNVDEDHIGGKEHATLEEYVNCKISFLSQCDTVIVNKETRFFDQVMSGCAGRRTLLYGHDDSCDGVIRNLVSDASGSRFEFGFENQWYAFETSLVGRFNVENLAAAILAAFVMGISVGTIQEGIRSVHIPGRMALMEYNGIHIVVDYAHNYLSFLNVYQAVKETFSPKHIHSLFGSQGERSQVRRRDVGVLAEKYADYVYLTADDPGYEDVTEICMEIGKHITKPCRIIPDREEAVREALSAAEPGDVVILAGKGAEVTQRVRDKFVPYISDVKAAQRWIAEQKERTFS
ncbi:MAG: UDP-N-acetylmuramoyl-L-alanyl-D-glutamate--2,6-diaminopimelate ligase [Lachnospiraceae bacterium]|nr:UDP-N-acetylmuramoyl-L-alanyl-D-glutamate--2,6-diaminopimelate ligase [Lachnospiraceae bacterium]